jgi:hypothetical protein
MADYSQFWSAARLMADSLRANDPQITGNAAELAEHLLSLPADQQQAVRNDLQLLLVYFDRLPLSLRVRMY